jgi:hypothetical protein
VKNIGKPCAGEPHARFDEGGQVAEPALYSTEGKELKYWGMHKHSRQHVYRARSKDCKVCPKKVECTRDRVRSVSYHIDEETIARARQLNKTKGYRISQEMRKKIEELFGEAKEFMGLRRAKFRGLKFVNEQVLMTALAQNIKRMVKILSKRGPNEAITFQNPRTYFLRGCFSRLLAWVISQ